MIANKIDLIMFYYHYKISLIILNDFVQFNILGINIYEYYYYKYNAQRIII